MADSRLALITPIGGGDRPDNALPPEISWPPVNWHPPYPSNGLPNGGQVGPPDNSIPIPPPFPNHDLPLPPSIWPGLPIHMPPGNETLPVEPGEVWPPLPPIIDKPVVALIVIPGLGYRWTVLSPHVSPTE